MGFFDALHEHISAPGIAYAIATISGGIVMLGWGIRFFRTVVGLIGFAASSVLAFIILANVDDRVGLGEHSREILISGSLISGIVGAAIGLWIWMAALGAAGALGGFGVAVWLLSWGSILKNKSSWERPAFISGATLAGAVLALVFEKAVIVAGTAIAGSLSICSGLDVFMGTGLNEAMRRIVVNRTIGTLEPETMAILVTALGLFLLGIIFQFRVSGQEERK